MNSWGLIIVAAGLFSVCGAVFDWDFFIDSGKARLIVRMFGRAAARVFYGILGVVGVVVGALITLGMLSQAS